MPFTRDQIAERAAQEIMPNSIVNLGIGLPTLIPGYLPEGNNVWFHSENGLLGMGPFPYEGEEDPQLINAGKQTVTVVPGGSFFHSAQSFAMIRGGHVDLAVLGAMQVSESGDLANWAIPGGRTMGIGGAMDLANGCRRLLVLMTHLNKKGDAKLLAQCNFPITAKDVVNRVITDLGVLDITDRGFKLVECAPDVSIEDLRAATAATIHVD
jgi:3-oxoacid CoA-transferase subunit B